MPRIVEAQNRRLSVGGRIRPRPHAPKLCLANYLRASLPAPPPALDLLDRPARAALGRMYLNDRLGDCVVAGAAHMIGAWKGEAAPESGPTLFSNAQIEAAYHNFSGGGYPAQDTGCDEEFALNFWAAKGFAPGAWNPHKIVCWVAVDAANRKEVETAIWLFGAVMAGVELPDAWINPPPESDGFVFDVAGDPVPTNGHCMTHFSYDANGIGCATWGMYGAVTWAALAKYMVGAANGALYAAVSQDALIRATGKAPNGFNAAQLVADAHAIGHAVSLRLAKSLRLALGEAQPLS
ncbi:hypothetical protein [Methylocystis bryophila]|uniref:Uncharacterized protein n=1 Tax=Methylocystis bryophila TaxID=655015 RepID=A0A1W6MX24_9HYPH|nr:hypothetical protein [Methylocystis bryophila]ARN82152.1 hypothetical protein B1812_14875 [Methylocystis bryophila]BDV38284.1 hypothetical protein DSM21852_15370 [Methylocystis bryophila]